MRRNHSMLSSRQPNRVAQLVMVAAVCGIAGFTLASCSNDPPNPNPRAAEPLNPAPVDLPRYMGRWYVIANIPYFAERDMVQTRAEWSLRPDGKIDDSYYGRKERFDAPEKHYQFLDTPKPGSQGGEWSVQVFWPVRVTQITLWVDPDYRYTILGYPGRKLGWIFSRDQDMDDATYKQMLARLDQLGYDTSRFRRVVQHPEQLGKPGFQTPGTKD